jgi:mono/diheme cytochrome c family protein
LYAQKPAALALLESRCLSCHNAASKQSGFDLSKRETALRGGDRGPGLAPGRARESYLYQVLAHTAKPAMPKFGPKFSEAELGLVAAWIDEGAPWDGGERGAAAAVALGV